MTPEEQAARRRDREARARAQREFSRPLVLQAGAGTGKTTVLTARVVVWLMGPGWERSEETLRAAAPGEPLQAARIAQRALSGVVAITFTEAAAAEMAQRIESALGSLARGESALGVDPACLPDDACVDGGIGVGEGDDERATRESLRRQRARALRGALDHLVVRTIHAWCRRLLAAHPMAARLHPDFAVDATGRVQAEVVHEVLEGALRAAYARPEPSPLLALAAAGIGPVRLHDALARLVDEGVTAAELDFDPLAPERIGAFHQELRAALVDFIRFDEEEPFPDRAPPELAARARDTLRLLDTPPDARSAPGSADSPYAVARADSIAVDSLELEARSIRELWEKRRGLLAQWGRGTLPRKIAEERREALTAASARLHVAVETARRLKPRTLAAAHAALRALLAEIESEMRSRGAVTYAGLLRGARDLLRDQPGIACALRRELDQLLVDEFQDTDAQQCDLVRVLALEGPEDERPGLFVVGDPKQSIYGWRSADLAAYDAFLKSVVAGGGEVLPLSVNFRSVPAILAEVSRAIEPIMHAREGIQPAFEALHACDDKVGDAGFSSASAAAVEHWVSWELDERDGRSNTKSGTANALEARAFARDVRRLHDEDGVALCDVALLVRSRSDLDLYLEALREADIPYAVAGERSYYQRREIVEATATLRCILDPNDHVALLAFLRSSVVGVPDAALIPLWAQDLPQRAGRLYGEAQARRAELEQIVADVVRDLPEVPGIERIAGWERNLLDGLGAVARLRLSFENDAPDRFVERLRGELLAEVSEAGRFPAAFRVANLERFFRDLAEELAAGADEQALLRRLRSAGERERDADEPVAAVGDAVVATTIHGAKGLGFSHVYLAQTHKGESRFGGSDAIEPGPGNPEYRLLGLQTLGFAQASERRREIEASERVRTLYVALTRAKQRLVVMGSWPRDGKSFEPERATRYSKLLASRLQRPPSLSDQMDVLAQRGAHAFVDACGVRWCFPALDTRSPVARRSSGAAPLDLERVRDESDLVMAARARAAKYMKRPLRGAASREAHVLLREEAAAVGFGEAGVPDDERDDARAARRPPGRDAAMAAGTAVHALLEDWDLGAEAAGELERQCARLPAVAAACRLGAEAIDEAERILRTFVNTDLFERFVALGDRCVARELPVWIPSDAAVDAHESAEPEGDETEAPVMGIAGAVDLVYRDETGDLVVVDYKSDRVEGDAMRERAEAYAAQGRIYTRALAEGLGLATPPRFELWFLQSGEILVV